MTKKNFKEDKDCPNCYNGVLSVAKKTKLVEYKGENISVTYRYLRCKKCHSEFISDQLDDPFEMAKEKYKLNFRSKDKEEE